MTLTLTAVGQGVYAFPKGAFGNFSAAKKAAEEKATNSKGFSNVSSAKKELKQPLSLSGKVVETMDAGGYSYVCLEKNGAKSWVAVPQMKVKVGQEMAFIPGEEMNDFTSKTLKRTFDRIVFSNGPIEQKKAAPKSASKGAATAVDIENIKIEKAAGPNAYTVAELYKNKKALNKKKVVVKGKVVKGFNRDHEKKLGTSA